MINCRVARALLDAIHLISFFFPSLLLVDIPCFTLTVDDEKGEP